MHRERVSENVFWFQSEIYAQVTAGVIVGPQWAVVIDTLALHMSLTGQWCWSTSNYAFYFNYLVSSCEIKMEVYFSIVFYNN